MGTFEDIQRQLGPKFFDREGRAPGERMVSHNWQIVCSCGHLGRYHAPSIGGTYQMLATEVLISRDVEWTRTVVFAGCVGALKTRGFEEETVESNQTDRTILRTIHPTCPCTAFLEVAKVDRPNRFFNQRMPVDRTDPLRHPLVIGIKAFSTHLSRRRAALADPSWAVREFDRRFQWTDGRVCAISKCRETDDVWPVFVDGDRSELRCPKHRPD